MYATKWILRIKPKTSKNTKKWLLTVKWGHVWAVCKCMYSQPIIEVQNFVNFLSLSLSLSRNNKASNKLSANFFPFVLLSFRQIPNSLSSLSLLSHSRRGANKLLGWIWSQNKDLRWKDFSFENKTREDAINWLHRRWFKL